MQTPWEDLISLNSHADFNASVLEPPISFQNTATLINPDIIGARDFIRKCLSLDTYNLPETRDREGYCSDRHFEYWLLGLRDYVNLKGICESYGAELRRYLDFGCASGRVIRHFAAYEPEMDVYGCDINARHVAWCLSYLPKNLTVFQNTSVPHLPLPDNHLDLLTAFSVFTHIEAFETTWLMEINRVLRPGGLAYLSAHTDHTLLAMDENWPICAALKRHPEFSPEIIGAPMAKEKMVFRWKNDRSYSSNVFLRTDYIERVWGRFFEILDIRRQFPGYQDAVLLQKSTKGT